MYTEQMNNHVCILCRQYVLYGRPPGRGVRRKQGLIITIQFLIKCIITMRNHNNNKECILIINERQPTICFAWSSKTKDLPHSAPSDICVYVCMYVCVCIYIYIYIYM